MKLLYISKWKIQTSSLKKKTKNKKPRFHNSIVTISVLEINLKNRKDARFEPKALQTINKKEGQEVTKSWGNTCKFQPNARGCLKTHRIRYLKSPT